MAVKLQPTLHRRYPEFSKLAKIHPEMRREIRLLYDTIYDVRDAVMGLVQPPVAIAQIDNTGALSNAIPAFPGIGVQRIKSITVTGGGGSGAAVTGRVVNGRVILSVSKPGTGYTFPPNIEVVTE